MANRRPIVLKDGRPHELPVGDTSADANAVAIQDVSVDPTTPIAGQALIFDGTKYSPASPTGVRSLQVEVNFVNPNFPEDTTAKTTVTGLPWVNSSSILLSNPFGGVTSDHESEDALAEGITSYIENIVPGVGFDVALSAPNGSWGRYLVNVLGV